MAHSTAVAASVADALLSAPAARQLCETWGDFREGSTMATQQNYSNHVRRDSAFLALTVLNLTLFVTAAVQLVKQYDLLHWFLLGLAVSAWSAAMATRHYALKNQNRTIRLEENVRLHHLGVDPRGLTLQQLIALRFASDAEVPALAARSISERLEPKAIKQAIVQWRADHDRV